MYVLHIQAFVSLKYQLGEKHDRFCESNSLDRTLVTLTLITHYLHPPLPPPSVKMSLNKQQSCRYMTEVRLAELAL